MMPKQLIKDLKKMAELQSLIDCEKADELDFEKWGVLCTKNVAEIQKGLQLIIDAGMLEINLDMKRVRKEFKKYEYVVLRIDDCFESTGITLLPGEMIAGGMPSKEKKADNVHEQKI